MTFGWKKVTANVYRLDDRWQIVQETPGQWRCYRNDRAMLAEFKTAMGAMEEAERLQKADKLYEKGETD